MRRVLVTSAAFTCFGDIFAKIDEEVHLDETSKEPNTEKLPAYLRYKEFTGIDIYGGEKIEFLEALINRNKN